MARGGIKNSGLGREGHEELRRFLTSMERDLAATGAPPMSDHRKFYLFQKQKFEDLLVLEDQFRDKLARSKSGRAVYRRFLRFVMKRGVLSGRPYFRARQDHFNAKIGKTIVAADIDAVVKFRINYRFVRWVLADGHVGTQLRDLAAQIAKTRHVSATLLIPLALSRVRLFWSRTQRSHLTYLDMVGTAAEGLLACVDKFVPPFLKVYRAVAIGRITSLLIDKYSETSIHFYPGDKRLLYRANKHARKVLGDGLEQLDYDDLVQRIRKENPEERIAPRALADMMAAASTVSLEGTTGLGREVRSMAAPSDEAPDALVERREMMRRAGELAASVQLLIERKLLQMLGMMAVD